MSQQQKASTIALATCYSPRSMTLCSDCKERKAQAEIAKEQAIAHEMAFEKGELRVPMASEIETNLLAELEGAPYTIDGD